MATNPNFTEIGITPPVWMGDFPNRDSILPAPAKLEAAQFMAEDGSKIVVGAAGALANAVLVPIKTALKNKIPAGTALVLNAAAKKIAVLSAEAPIGAVSLAVHPLPTALVEDDTATYLGIGKKRVPSGTLVGRTYAERTAGTGYGPADVENDDEIYLSAREAADLSKNNDMEMYRPGRLVKENFLPEWSTHPAGTKAKIRELYHCIEGVA